jgi:lipoprotein-releasing system permease protein
MSLSYFIARRLYGENNGGKRVSRPAVVIALIGIAVGLAVMLLTVAIVVGFKSEVRGKVTGFGSDIQLSEFNGIRSYETTPVVVDGNMMKQLKSYDGVAHVQRYSTKPGIIKTDDDFQGMVLKGVGQEFDPSFFTANLVEGEIPQFTDSVSSGSVVISKTIADKLKLSLGDKIYTYYIQDDVRVRPMKICGIYETNFSEYDNLFLLTDIYTVNRLNGWEADQVTGAEIRLADYDRLDEVCSRMGADLDRTIDRYGSIYYVQSIESLNPQIFEWLDLLDLNVIVILILMISVAGFTMISGLLILIIERTNMIGILKALGANNFTIRKVFLWFSVFLIGKGMIWGNVIGLSLCLLQSRFHIFKLDPQNYYIDAVPILLNPWVVIALNVATLLVAVLMLIGPSYLITKINPATSMRYE